MKIFKTNKLEIKAKLEKEGFRCSEEKGKESVDFVFELEEDVIVEEVLLRDTERPSSKKQKKEEKTEKNEEKKVEKKKEKKKGKK